ncbi:hypothetical protein Y032_0119g850 [Ancylostoma ceylanicum]|uniref:Uncharacterized protein n=1 Tax=Ancylostoma ceylanicum TaxID=53326 RepID=A0A016TB66_9BILA|nr:hypothetical protein Y032_0119g850 [Ancylostoma ceylanicum]
MIRWICSYTVRAWLAVVSLQAYQFFVLTHPFSCSFEMLGNLKTIAANKIKDARFVKNDVAHSMREQSNINSFLSCLQTK